MVKEAFSIGEAVSAHLQNLYSLSPFKNRGEIFRKGKSSNPLSSQKNPLHTSAHVTMQPMDKKVLSYKDNLTTSDGENSIHQLYGPHTSSQLDIKKYRLEKKRILQRWDSSNDSNKKLFLSNTSDNESDTDQPTWIISIELKNGNFKKPARKPNVTIEKLPTSSIPHQDTIIPERTAILSTSQNSSSWNPSSMNSWIIFSTTSLVIIVNLFLFLLLRWKSASSEIEDKEEVLVELTQAASQSTAIATQPAIITIRSDPIRPTIGPKLMDYDSHLLLTPLRINRRQIQPSSSGFERGSLHSISSNNSNSSRSNSNSNSSNSVSMSAASSCKRFTPLPYPLMVPSSAQDTLLPFSSTSGGGGNRKQQVALSSSSFEDSPCKLNLQMGLLTPPTAERGVIHRHLRTTATHSHSVRGLLPGTDTDIGDLSDIYECNDVINESATLEDGSTSLFVDPVFTDSHLDISELYRNTEVDGSNDHSGGGGDDEDDSTPSNQNSLAEELASFFVDDNPALEALQLRQLSLSGTEKASSMGNHRSPNTSPCSLKTPLSQNGILSTSFNHDYIVGDSCLPKEENNLDLSKESIDVHNTEVEHDGNNKTCIAQEDSDQSSNGCCDNSSIFATPASFQEETDPVINAGMLISSTPLNNILTVRTSSTAKYDDEAAFGFSVSNDCDKENLTPAENEEISLFEVNKKIESHPLTPPALAAASVVVVDDRELTAQIDETVVEERSCESTPIVLLDHNGSKPTSSQEQHIDCSRSCSTRSIEYMAVERHYIDLNLSTVSADSYDDLGSVVPGFSKAHTSDGDDNETINLVRRPSINKIIEIELQSYVQQQLLNKEQLKVGPKTTNALHLPPASKQSSNKSGNNFVVNPKRAVPLQKQKQYGAPNSGGIGIGMEAKVRRASFSASGSRSRSRSPPPLPFEALQKSPPSKYYNSTTSSPTPPGGKSKSVLNSSHGQVRKVADGVMNDLSPIKSTTTSSSSRKMPGVTTTTSTSAIITTATANEKAKKDVKYRKKS